MYSADSFSVALFYQIHILNVCMYVCSIIPMFFTIDAFIDLLMSIQHTTFFFNIPLMPLLTISVVLIT